MGGMTRQEEAVDDAKARLKELDFKVEVARKAAEQAPDDHAARGQLDMMVAIREVARGDLEKAESKLAAEPKTV